MTSLAASITGSAAAPSFDMASPRSESEVETVSFGRFTVIPSRRTLLKDGAPIEIGGRAFDLLVVLCRTRGEVIQKRKIVDFVWPSTIVDESNLRFQMATLRRVLGEERDRIKTIQGRGYMFIADTVPAAPTTKAFNRPEEVAPPRPPAGSGLATMAQVAVIEDDDDTREALNGLLRSSGLEPHCFASPQAFMDSTASSTARCLVLDVCLPGRSGLDFHVEMRRSGIRTPVIFISGHADVPMSVRAMKAGAVEFLTKPVRHEELLRAINDAVASRPS